MVVVLVGVVGVAVTRLSLRVVFGGGGGGLGGGGGIPGASQEERGEWG